MGIIFLTGRWRKWAMLRKHIPCFRPLMGIIFLTDIPYWVSIDYQGTFEFPSPYGDYFFNHEKSMILKISLPVECFRPLMGIIFLTP